jgi:hypothetical protein
MNGETESSSGKPEELIFNGLNAETGEYLFPPMKLDEIPGFARDTEEDEAYIAASKKRAEEAVYGTVSWVEDDTDLGHAGWGVILADKDKEAEAVKEALSELLEHRKAQAQREKAEHYQEYTYYEGDSAIDFVAVYADPFGPADPDKMPYYLLIVGDPDKIPYSFQYQLDTQRAVGRIHFTKADGSADLEAYAQYAHNVVQAERQAEAGTLALPRQAAFFGVRNEGDGATRLSANHLVTPLAEALGKRTQDRKMGWDIQPLIGDKAYKHDLAHLLGGDGTPALVFTASHGAGFPSGGESQLRHQGALVCQDWPGRVAWGGQPLSEDHYFSADDVASNAQMLGLLTFHFACFGAGTPAENDFTHHRGFGEPVSIAPHAFVAGLPQKLLSRGALATVGHVERAWSYSFRWAYEDYFTAFEDALYQLLLGYPVGKAMESINSRYTTLTASLNYTIDKKIRKGKPVDPGDFARDWTACNDARSYVIVGDPAARLFLQPVDAGEEPVRPDVERVTLSTGAAGEGGEEHTGEVSAAEEVVPAEGEEEFGLFGRDREPKEGDEEREESGLKRSLRELTDRLGQAISNLAQDAATLEVKTYSSDDMTGVQFKKGKFEGDVQPTLRALTYVKLDGDMTVVVPQGDAELWAIHSEMVEKAQANRAKIIEIAISAATSIVNILE